MPLSKIYENIHSKPLRGQPQVFRTIDQTFREHEEMCYNAWYIKERGYFEVVKFIQEQTGIQQYISQTPLEDVDERTKAFLAFSGTWEDERPVEEIIRDIYESRTLGREEVIL